MTLQITLPVEALEAMANQTTDAMTRRQIGNLLSRGVLSNIPSAAPEARVQWQYRDKAWSGFAPSWYNVSEDRVGQLRREGFQVRALVNGEVLQ